MNPALPDGYHPLGELDTAKVAASVNPVVYMT